MYQPTSPIIGVCVYCGDPATDRDHVVPRSRGGTEIVPACRPCNCSKHAKTPTEWMRALHLADLAGRGNPRLPHIVAHLLGSDQIIIDWQVVHDAQWTYVQSRLHQHREFLAKATAALGTVVR